MTSSKGVKTDRRNSEPRIVSVRLDRIKIDGNRRKCGDDAINDLAVSIRDIGLLNPINVINTGKNDEGKTSYTLTAGLARLKAAERLGWRRINATILEGDDEQIRLCEIAENLFRSELTVLERSELISEWVAIAGRKGDHGGHPGGRQPHDRGISEAARKLKLSRAMIGRSKIIAALSKEAKSAAKAANLDDSTRHLLQIAEEKSPAEQLDRIEKIRSRKAAKKPAKTEKTKKSKNKESKLQELDAPNITSGVDREEEHSLVGEDAEADFYSLKAAWQNSPGFIAAWNAAGPPARERFINEVLRYSTKSVASHANETASAP